MKITIGDEPPDANRSSKWSELYFAYNELNVGQWMSVELASTSELISARSSLGTKVGSGRFRTRSAGNKLYIQKQ